MKSDPMKAPRPSLEHLESVITQALPSLETHEQAALALLEIHTLKLFKPLDRSFKAYVERRWPFGRARAYQMLHFARLRRLSTEVDNERQARKLDSEGKARKPDEDLCEKGMNYLVRLWERLRSYEECPEFIETMRSILRDFERDLVKEAQTGLAPKPEDPKMKNEPNSY